MIEYFFALDFLWALLIAILLAVAFNYGTRNRTYRYANSGWVNFLVVIIGSILLGSLFVWIIGNLGLALLTGAWEGILGTLLGGLVVIAFLWWIGTEYVDNTY